MSNGPISLPHINLRPQEEEDSRDYEGLPPMHQQPPQNNYYHPNSYPREGKIPDYPIVHESHALHSCVFGPFIRLVLRQ